MSKKERRGHGFVFQCCLAVLGSIVVSLENLLRFPRSKDGDRQAENFLGQMYDSHCAVFVGGLQRLEQSLRTTLKRLENEQKAAVQAVEDFVSASNLKWMELPPAPVWMQWVQPGLVAGMLVMTGLGTAAIMNLLAMSGESFADSLWRSLTYALSINCVMIVGVKCFLKLVPVQGVQTGLALVTCGIGLAAGGYSLVGNSELFAPQSKGEIAKEIADITKIDLGAQVSATVDEFSEDDWGEPVAAPQADASDPASTLPLDVPAPEPVSTEPEKVEEASIGSLFKSQHLIAMQVLAEACLTAVMGFFFARNIKSFRNASLRDLPACRALQKRVDALIAETAKVDAQLGDVEGQLDTVAAERPVFIETVMGRVRNFGD